MISSETSVTILYMNKTTTTIIVTAVVAFALGLCIGSAMGKGHVRGGPGWHRGPGMDRDMSNMQMQGGMGNGMMGGANGGMQGAMQGMMAGLDGKTGDDFDKAFLSEMIMHHQGAVDMAQLALTNAKHQEIKDLAKNIIDAQNKEIADMKKWQGSWYAQQ